MINWEATGNLVDQRRARQQRFADAVQSLDTQDEDEAHEPLRHPLTAPRPTLGAAPPVATPRPPVGRIRAYFPAQDPSGPTPVPGQAYGPTSVATLQQGALAHTTPTTVNGRAMPTGSV